MAGWSKNELLAFLSPSASRTFCGQRYDQFNFLSRKGPPTSVFSSQHICIGYCLVRFDSVRIASKFAKRKQSGFTLIAFRLCWDNRFILDHKRKQILVNVCQFSSVEKNCLRNCFYINFCEFHFKGNDFALLKVFSPSNWSDFIFQLVFLN
jgi:hypothetical protein